MKLRQQLTLNQKKVEQLLLSGHLFQNTQAMQSLSWVTAITYQTNSKEKFTQVRYKWRLIIQLMLALHQKTTIIRQIIQRPITMERLLMWPMHQSIQAKWNQCQEVSILLQTNFMAMVLLFLRLVEYLHFPATLSLCLESTTLSLIDQLWSGLVLDIMPQMQPILTLEMHH